RHTLAALSPRQRRRGEASPRPHPRERFSRGTSAAALAPLPPDDGARRPGSGEAPSKMNQVPGGLLPLLPAREVLLPRTGGAGIISDGSNPSRTRSNGTNPRGRPGEA
ncbi:unnamed protein product, partial [Ixodes persulcatus]